MNRLACIALFLIAMTADLKAQVWNLYVVDGEFVDGRTSTLYRIDPESGAVLETIGDTGENLVAIAVDSFSGELFGITASNSNFPDALVRIDTRTAAVELVGTLSPEWGGAVPGITDVYFDVRAVRNQDGLAQDLPVLVAQTEGDEEPEIKYIRLSDAVMVQSLFVSGVGPILWTENLAEGRAGIAAAPAGPQNLDAASLGCAVTDGSSLYSSFYLGYAPGGDPPQPPGIVLDLPDETCVNSAARGLDNAIYGVGVSLAGGASRTLLRFGIAPDAIDITSMGPLPDDTAGIAIGPLPAEAVPVLGQVWLMWLSVGVLVAGIATLRGRTGSAWDR